MVTNVELESRFKAFSQDFKAILEITKEQGRLWTNYVRKWIQKMQSTNNILCFMWEAMNKPEVAILAKYPGRVAIY